MVQYLYEREKKKEERAKTFAKPGPSKEVDEIFRYYMLYIRESARPSPYSREAIRKCLAAFGRESMIAVMEKITKDKWWMDNNARRGATWFFGNKNRFQRWVEAGIPVQKKRPYWRNQPMTHDCKKALVDGEWKEYVGSNKEIEWREI